ncbi:hypothetical protein AAC387_Pa06g0652 [Persea americana]
MASFSSETKSKPRPLMLKDFLRDDPNSSSNDFHSFPRRSDTTVRKLLEIDLNSGDAFRETRLSRSRSRTNAISAFQKASEAIINAVKQFPFSSAKPPPKHGFLPRSFSQTLRRSFRKKNEKEKHEIRAMVRVRDIIRWKSFRDEEKKLKHLPCSISGSGSSRSSSSWNESDFTSDFSSDCSVENDGKKHLPKKTGGVGEDSMETATCYGQPKVKQWKEEDSRGPLESTYEEEDQLSPVSVLDFSNEDEEIETPSSSSFEDSLANMERTKQHLLQKIRRFECLAQVDPVDLEKRIAQSELEEEAEEVVQAEDKAGDLLQLFKASSKKSHTPNTDKLLLDFFREELATSQRNLIRQPEVDGIEEKLLSAASDWMNGYVELEWGLQDNREACLREMTRDQRWRRFKEEEEKLAMEMESGVLGSLVEELLLDLFH